MSAVELIFTPQPVRNLLMTGPMAPLTISITPPPTTQVVLNEAPPGSVTTDGVESLSNKTLVDPKIDDAIYDTAGHILLAMAGAASAVNYASVFNAAAGSPAGVEVMGADSNISYNIITKGTGQLLVNGSAVQLASTAATLTGTQTLTNKTLTSPRVGTAVLDTNGNEVFLVTATASAVNEVTVANAATGSGPTLSATGGDTNVDLNLAAKGAGGVKIGGNVVTTAGTQTVWIPAGAIKATTTSGAAIGAVETTTNKVMLNTLDFDAAAVEYGQFSIAMPKSWNEGTVTAQFVWSHAATTTNFGVAWSLAGLSLSDDDAADAAFGTAQTATDTGGTTNDIYITAATSAITIAGTPAEGDWVVFRVAREVANGSDTMAIDARLHGVRLLYTTNAANDA